MMNWLGSFSFRLHEFWRPFAARTLTNHFFFDFDPWALVFMLVNTLCKTVFSRLKKSISRYLLNSRRKTPPKFVETKKATSAFELHLNFISNFIVYKFLVLGVSISV